MSGVTKPLFCAVLAAGLSRRAGKVNKLLAPVSGAPMIQKVVEALIASGQDDIVVVLGHEAERVREVLVKYPLKFAINQRYEEGMGRSIAAAVENAALDRYSGIVLCLGDLPWLKPEEIKNAVKVFYDSKCSKIVVPTHKGTHGHPVIFPIEYAKSLKDLSGDGGAKRLISKNRDQVVYLEMNTSSCIRDVDVID